VPILSAAPELAHRVEHAGCKAVLFDDERAALVTQAVAGLAALPACVALEKLARRTSDAPRGPIDTAPGETAMVLYTSGTTGQAKGAAISHASLLTHCAVLAHHTLRLTAQDSVLGVLPLTHSYGCRMVVLASFFAGARVVLLPRFDAARSLALMQEHSVSWVPAVPTMYAAWAAEPLGPPLRTLRWCLCAGAPLADTVAVRAEQRLGAEVRQGYGMTEATFSTVNAPPDARVLGSVGKPVWGIEVRVVNDAGVELASGMDGEVVVRGHNVMSRYLHDEGATAEVSAGGFLHSGDVGRFDNEGRLTIVDRLKDLIIRGGNNVYPSEVEDALAAHPAVQEVAVVGRPDDYYGEEVVAVVVKRPDATVTAGDLVAFALTRVARTKVPREVAFVTSLPLGLSGKVHKRTLRRWLIDAQLATEKPTVPKQSNSEGTP
jgi:long-chain acyl-CoA synthetase